MSAGSPTRQHPESRPTGASPLPAARLGRSGRIGLLIAALVVLAVLGIARWLRPDPSGFGTHQQLGLLPCTFRSITGYGCPSCGMTTAFAWFVRGRLDASWGTNPAGCLLAGACVAMVPWMLFGAASGRAWGVRSLDDAFLRLLVAAAAVTLVVWVGRAFF